MFVLYNSNRTEALADQLAEVIDQGGGHSFFKKTLFLVQSREMERMLSQFLADRFGVWGNSRYLLPRQFLEHVCQALEIDLVSSSFERSILGWRLESLLKDLDDPALMPLKSYLSGEQPEVKRYQLARQTAHLFDQYQIMRPALIKSWEKGQVLTSSREEVWQFHLWHLLRQQGGDRHRGEIIGSLIDFLGKGPRELPDELKRIFVFGLHTLPPLFLSVLRALSLSADIHFFLLTPCALYWGDIETRRKRTVRQLSEDEEKEGVYHPLLSGLGRQGADFQELLLERVEELVDGPDLFVKNSRSAGMSVLQLLQNDLLEGCYRKMENNILKPAPDDSVIVVSCHTRMRETAVVKDHIFKWLSDDPDLGLHDIVVMAPDIQLYADLIPAVFDDVAHDISDCHKRRDNRYVEIFSQFLDLFSGRFSGPDIVSFLEHFEVGSAFSITSSDLETIRKWLKEVGIRWGLSGEQRSQDGLFDFDSGSWSDGLERMLLGLAAGSTDPVNSLIPYIDLEGSEADLLGNLCQFIELIEQSRREFQQSRTLDGWSALLYQTSSRLFAEQDSAALLNLQEILTGLTEHYSEYHQDEVTFPVIRQWFDHEAEATSSINFLRGRLTFCSLLPMRSIPFKIICLLGLNDGDFPQQDRFLPFDLLSKSYERGDRSQRADDRYQFLEAILAARQRLYLSYTGQSIRTNEEVPPSPVVSELLESIEYSYGPIRVVNQPLQPFSPLYFSGTSGLFSHHDYYCRTAQALQAGNQSQVGPWLQEPLDVRVADRVSLADLFSFVGNPQRYFVRAVLKMRLDTGQEVLEDHEPFSLDGLQKYLVSQELVDRMINSGDVEELFNELSQRQVWPLGVPGRLRFDELHSDLANFVESIRGLDCGAPLENLDFDIEIGGSRIDGVLDNRFEHGRRAYRYGSLSGRDLLQGWLLHLVDGEAGGRRGATKLVLKDAIVTIDEQTGGADDLNSLLDLYLEGCRYPSRLYVEAAFEFCRQVLKNRGKGRTPPLKKAVTLLKRRIDNGYANELDLLFPGLDAAALLDTEFERLSTELILPIVERIKIEDNG